ncbi:MAG: dipeptidase [bacterium]
MLIIDGDYPMAFGAVELNRDLTLPIREIRQATPDRYAQESYPDSETMASLPELRKAKVAAALVKVVGRIHRPGSPLWGYRSGEAAYANAQAALAYYRILEARKQVRILKTRSDLTDHMRTWSEAIEHASLPVGFILGMEGADPILWPEHVHDWWADGLRVVSLSHYGVSTYCHGTGTGTSGGLFPPAKALLREMDAVGMILDLTHASDASVREAMEIFSGPVLASHQNCRALVPGERQFPDEQLRAIIERGGVIGVSMDSWMLYKPGVDWAKIPARRSVFPREAVTLEDVADHIDHICRLAGNSRHAAIGGDTDGQGGRAGAPLEIDTVADYQKVAIVLERRGYSQDDIANVMYRNWQRFFETHLPT